MQQPKTAIVIVAIALGIGPFLAAGPVTARADDCNTNGISDECDLDCGTSGGPCDLPGCGQSLDCNTTGVPDECEAGNEGAGFAQLTSWTTYDAGSDGVGVDPDGYYGAAFDGQYVYFAPRNNGTTGYHGEVLRYDTAAIFSLPSSWTTFDVQSKIDGARGGYTGAVFHDPYVYFVPHVDNEGYHGVVLRYDTTQDFATNGSWETFDAPMELGAIGGYTGAVIGGGYIYFVPYGHTTGHHGEVLRYNTLADFLDPGSWATYDAGSNGVGVEPVGYEGGTFDGRYVYFAPRRRDSGEHGEVLRYDTWGSFSDADSWNAFDVTSPPVCAKGGYSGAVFDDQRYVYFVPNDDGSAKHGEVLRYDTTGSFSDSLSWSTFDPGDCLPPVAGNPDGFAQAIFDGRFIYFVPYEHDTEKHGEVLRYDTSATFSDCQAWAAYDYGEHCGQDCNDPDGYAGGAFDGQYIYFAPEHNGSEHHGEVLRYDTFSGWSPDCNTNGVPDECDMADCEPEELWCGDCNSNGMLDACEPDFDGDGLIDDCDPDIDNDEVLNEDDVCDYTPYPLPPGAVLLPSGTLRGDVDDDCDCDLADYAILQADFTGPNE